VREITKRTQEVLVGSAARKYKTNPRPRTSQRLDGRFDIWIIFVRAVAEGGIRGSDVMGNIGEIPRRRDVTGGMNAFFKTIFRICVDLQPSASASAC